MNKTGFVLLYTVVLALIVAIIAAGLASMMLMNYTATHRIIKADQNRKESDSLLSRAITYWNASNTVCSDIPGMPCAPASVPAPGFTGLCNCTCTDPTGAAIVVSDPDGTPGPPCDLSIESSDSF